MQKDIGGPDVAREARKLGRELGPAQAEALARYLTILVRWNARMNLVGPSRWQDILTTLVADSWHLADFLEAIDLPADPLTLDLGAGAGIPGIPLRLFWTRGDYWMVEARQKRAIFIRQAVVETGVERTGVFADRVERLPDRLRRADLVLSRAFMPWREYLALAGTILAPGGTVLVMASQPAPENPPQSWASGPGRTYVAGGETRYFWSFTPDSAAS
jgi:16S rRNA (guanine527-N7)-methyltransferase